MDTCGIIVFTTVAKGRVIGEKVRAFGNFSGSHEIEAVAVDDELGYIYYADEDSGIRQWRADPDHPEAGREITVFGRDGFVGNREGIAIYSQAGGKRLRGLRRSASCIRAITGTTCWVLCGAAPTPQTYRDRFTAARPAFHQWSVHRDEYTRSELRPV